MKRSNRLKSTGEILASARKEKNISLVRVSDDTKIKIEIIKAFEANASTNLSPKYHEALLDSYAKYLGVKLTPRTGYTLAKTAKNKKKQRPIRVIASSNLIISAIVGVFLMLFVGYVAWQSYQLVKKPQLQILNPTTSYLSKEPAVDLRGITEPEAEVFVNGERLVADTSGEFKIRVALQVGVNEIEVIAVNAFSRRNVDNVTVVYRPNH